MNFEEIQCKSAEEFISILRPSNKMWDGPINGWIFRGQRDSSWGLIPSVFRIDPKIWPGCSTSLCLDYGEQIAQELNLLRIFVKHADEVGLKIPGDSSEFRRKNLYDCVGTWPGSIPLEVMAKGQHHGLPTRLLDFTHHGLAAAHFAVSDVLEGLILPKEKQPWDKYFIVWAFCLSNYQKHFRDSGRRLQVVSAPSSDNDFLFKQKGLFLFDAELYHKWIRNPENREKFVDLLTAFEDENNGVQKALGIGDVFKAKKILLDKSEASKVNEILYREGFTHAYFRPSFHWVINTIRYERQMNFERN